MVHMLDFAFEIKDLRNYELETRGNMVGYWLREDSKGEREGQEGSLTAIKA